MTSATEAARPEGNQTLRLAPLVVPVATGGIAVLAAAVVSLATSSSTTGVLAGILALAVASVVVEAYPVPVEGVPSGAVSLGAVFIVGAAVVYGWEAAVLVGFATRLLIDVIERRPPIRFLYNAGVYALGSAAAGVAAENVGHSEGVAQVFLAVTVGAVAFYSTNVILIALVISLWARQPLLPIVRSSVYWTIVPFSIMASVSLILAVLWERSPLLSAALIGPLVAIALYQRSVHESLKAMRLALTDPLTGLGNHRHFHERLQRALDDAEASGTPLTVCLIDIDNFKGINDSFGHPVGDRVLAQVAARLRQGGEAFRLGGDEFALLLAGKTDTEGLTIAESVIERVAVSEYDHGDPVTVSAGIATYPRHSLERTELVRIADSALYWSKEHGRGRAHIFRPEVEELAELRWLVEGRDRAACLRAAASLAHAVDVRDAYTGSHSYVVGELAARVATRMGLEQQEIELLRLAGSLHDLGKLAIPEEILRKPGPLTEAERLVLERHPQIGYRMLDSLGVDPVAHWVLHHHERWDGMGYPDRLAKNDIPLGARILFVADAYDAMTTDRVYRGRLPHDRAITELERCAGTQFDPEVVAAFKVEFAEAEPEPESALAVTG
jgi:diguanylate cyclase (GGDEF)-like protein